MHKDEQKGQHPHRKLIIIGGAEDRDDECEILQEFVRAAGGADARIALMTVATSMPLEAAAVYRKTFGKLGVQNAEIVDVGSRKDVNLPESMRFLETATGIFFTGGDQLHITSLLGGSDMQELIRKRYEEGVALAGTSAGAAMMTSSMIIRGESDCSPRCGGLEIGPGMNILQDAVIETHFSQRGRFGRLLAAVAHYPQNIGYGIDENTALVLHEDEVRVIGQNSVTVVDASHITYTNLPELRDGDALTLHNVRVHVLSRGQAFNWREREPVELDARRKSARTRPETRDQPQAHR